MSRLWASIGLTSSRVTGRKRACRLGVLAVFASWPTLKLTTAVRVRTLSAQSRQRRVGLATLGDMGALGRSGREVGLVKQTAARRQGRAGDSPAPSSWAALLDPAHLLSTVVVLLGILTPAINSFITSTVLPSAVAEIGGLAIYAWASTAYAVTSIVGSASCSVVTRKAGPRMGLLVAALFFVAGTAACGAAPTMLVMIGGRAIQGLGGGMMIAGVYSAVRELFPEVLW